MSQSDVPEAPGPNFDAGPPAVASVGGGSGDFVSSVSVAYSDGPVLRRYSLWLTAALCGVTATASVTSVLLPNQIQSLTVGRFFSGDDADVNLQRLNDLKAAVASGQVQPTGDQARLLGLLADFDASRATSLALVLALGTIGAMIIQPVVGVLSDRTTSPMGRRAPWILLGAVLGALGMVALRYAPGVIAVALLWTVVLTSANAVLAPLTATIADRVPDTRRGGVSAVSGLGNFVGGMGGAVLVGVFFGVVGLDLYFAFALFLAATAALFVLRNPDLSSQGLTLPTFRWRTFWKGFVVPMRARDFRWVWLARLMLTFGFTVSTSLSFFMLQSYVQPGLSDAQATRIAPLLGVAGVPFAIVAILVVGRWSDRVGRRKPFVIGASVLMAFSMLVPILSPTLPALFAQAVMASTAFGVYLPIDQALFIDVLPDPDSAGRDLGVASVATTAGQVLAPVLAAQIVALSGGYLLVWVVALILVALSALAVVPVRAVA